MIWTEDAESRLRELWARGDTASEIAQELGISRNAVLGKKMRLGLSHRHSGWPAAIASMKRHGVKLGRKLGQKVRRAAPIERTKPKPQAKPQVKLIAKEGRVLEPLNIPLWELDRGDCRFPTIERDGRQFFCGRPQEHGTSYCDNCARIAFTPEGYERTVGKISLRQPMNGYVAKPFVMPVMGGLVREVPFS